jgi:biopolymer transport protein ExbD
MKIKFSRSKQSGTIVAETVKDIDVTPVMNMFVILIPFLVSMAVFTQMSIISFSLPPEAGTNLGNTGKPQLKLTIIVTPEHFAITHGEKMLDSLPNTGTTESYTLLLAKIKERRNSIDIQNETVIAVRDAVNFQQIVKVMDICRSAGFEKIGVSSATDNAEKGV